MSDVIEYLVAHGAYVEAARIAAERGELRRAIALYERVWRFADALPLALDAGRSRRWPCAWRWTPTCPRAPPRSPTARRPPTRPGRGRRRVRRPRAVLRGRRAPPSARGDWPRAAALYRRAGAPDRRGARPRARRRAARGRACSTNAWWRRAAATRPPPRGWRSGACSAAWAGTRRRPATCRPPARTPALRTAALRALCAPLLALGFRGAADRGRGAAAPGRPDAAARARGVRRRWRRPRRPPPKATRAARPSRAAARHGAARAPVRASAGCSAAARPAASTRPSTRCWACRSRSSCCSSAARPPIRSARRTFASRARRRRPGRLRHPNIVALYDAQPASGLFVFELMPGGTLADRLATGGPLTPAAGRRLALDLLAALGAAHERGIVHRDVKPANVFFDAAGNAKLGDFGGAHLVDFGQTQSGGFLGTLAYMSPEQISNAPIGAAADFYALGATLFEALTGRPPFLGPDLGRAAPGRGAAAAAALRPALGALHDQTLRARWPRRPPIASASAVEMAEAVAAWPVERGARRRRQRRRDRRRAPGRRRRRRRAAAAIADEERELWLTDGGRLSLRRDARTARDVVVELRDEPLGTPRSTCLRKRRGRRRAVRAARAAAVRRSPRDLVRGAAGRAAAAGDADRRRTRRARRGAGGAARRAPRARSPAPPPARCCWSRPGLRVRANSALLAACLVDLLSLAWLIACLVACLPACLRGPPP